MACASAFDGSFGTNVDNFCNTFSSTSTSRTVPVDVFVTGSEVQRWGLGVVQEIDSAAMHVYARWQHQELDLDLTGITQTFHSDGSITYNKQHVGQGFDRLGSVPGWRHHLLLSQPPERISIGSRPLRGGFFLS